MNHGYFPSRALKLVVEWMELHQAELLEGLATGQAAQLQSCRLLNPRHLCAAPFIAVATLFVGLPVMYAQDTAGPFTITITRKYLAGPITSLTLRALTEATLRGLRGSFVIRRPRDEGLADLRY